MRRLRQLHHLAIGSGLALCLAGAILLVVTWVQTARTTNVALQVPYVLSAGCAGLGLLVVGLTVISIATKRREAQERLAQTIELRELLAAVRRAVEGGAP